MRTSITTSTAPLSESTLTGDRPVTSRRHEKRLALVAYYFPPIGGAGTQRPAKLATYLPQYNWHCTVLADSPHRNSGNRGLFASGLDTRQTSQLPPGLPIYQIDSECADTWLAHATEHLTALIDSQSIDTVLVTMSPFWLAALVERLGERIPFVLDLRDPWALDGVRKYRHWFQWRSDLKRMGQALSKADQVIMNTPEACSAVLRAFPQLDSERVHAIPNGYDRADFEGIAAASRPDNSEFVLMHTGTFVTKHAVIPSNPTEWIKRQIHFRPEPIRPIGRSIGPLLEAIDLLRSRRPQFMQGFRFVHVGNLDEDTKSWIDRSPSRDIVDTVGFVAHDQSVERLLSADALFLHLHGLPSGHRSRIVPGKTYEYLASGRPILGALPEGDARDLLQPRGRCELADPCEPKSIARALESLIEKGSSVAVHPLSDTALSSFDRREIARRVAIVLDASIQDSPARNLQDVSMP